MAERRRELQWEGAVVQPDAGASVIPPSDVLLSLLQSDIGFGKLETYVKLDKLGEVSRP